MIYILLPAYNEKNNLIKMFKKIEKICLKIRNITVILVDDCSSDNTILLKNKRYKFKLIYQRHNHNKGLSITLETGFNTILKKGTCAKEEPRSAPMREYARARAP